MNNKKNIITAKLEFFPILMVSLSQILHKNFFIYHTQIITVFSMFVVTTNQFFVASDMLNFWGPENSWGQDPTIPPIVANNIIEHKDA